jgi:iron complex outermembrane recepter protein
MKKILKIFLFVISGIECFAQTEADTSATLQKIFTLGEVQISATVDKSTVDVAEMQKYNSKDVSTALRTMPSLILCENGSRSESTVYVRGFDIRSVPVFMDGIPVYVPYDGYVDLARFTIYDLARMMSLKAFHQ